MAVHSKTDRSMAMRHAHHAAKGQRGQNWTKSSRDRNARLVSADPAHVVRTGPAELGMRIGIEEDPFTP